MTVSERENERLFSRLGRSETVVSNQSYAVESETNEKMVMHQNTQ